MHICIATDDCPEGEPIKLPKPTTKEEEEVFAKFSEDIDPGGRWLMELPADSPLHGPLTELWLRCEVARTGEPLAVVRANHELGEALAAVDGDTELGFRYEGAWRRGEYDPERLTAERERYEGLIANVRTALDRMDAELAENITPASEAGAA